MNYFAISAPPADDEGGGDKAGIQVGDRVFRTVAEAVKAMKSIKNSRMKAFATQEEAEQFASELPNGYIDCFQIY